MMWRPPPVASRREAGLVRRAMGIIFADNPKLAVDPISN
jgi:hypothetical protein